MCGAVDVTSWLNVRFADALECTAESSKCQYAASTDCDIQLQPQTDAGRAQVCAHTDEQLYHCVRCTENSVAR
jgi:hypothetical protein